MTWMGESVTCSPAEWQETTVAAPGDHREAEVVQERQALLLGLTEDS